MGRLSEAQHATVAVMRAGMRAMEIRQEEGHVPESERRVGSIFIGAPSHSAAHLLAALAEQGWELRRKDQE